MSTLIHIQPYGKPFFVFQTMLFDYFITVDVVKIPGIGCSFVSELRQKGEQKKKKKKASRNVARLKVRDGALGARQTQRDGRPP